MSRRRYLSTDISTDTKVNRVAMRSDFAALLYTWMIPHCGDDASIKGDAEKIMLMVMPGRRDKSVEEFEAALQMLHDAGLIAWDRDGECVDYPASAFYKHQSYIKDGERRGKHASAAQSRETTHDPATPEPTAQNSADQRTVAQNAASFKSSFSSSFPVSSSSSSPNGDTHTSNDGPKRSKKPDLRGFAEFWIAYPRKVAKGAAESAWSRLDPGERDAALQAIQRQRSWPAFADAPPDKQPHPATWLNQRRWEDEPPPDPSRDIYDAFMRGATAPPSAYGGRR